MALRDGEDREQGGRGRRSDLSWGGTGRCGNVDEPLEQLVEGGLAVVDGGAFVVGERDAGQHALKVVFGLE